jgi:two-component system, OmpR family, sensor kinase
MKALIRRYFEPKSLLFQLLSRSLLFMAILLVAIGFFQYIFMREFTFSNKASSIQTQIMSTPPDMWEQMQRSVQGNVPNRFPFFFSPDASIALVEGVGDNLQLSNLSNRTSPQLSNEDYQNALRTKRKLNYRVVNQTDGGEQLVVFQAIDLHGHQAGLVQVSVSTKPLKEVLIRQLLTFLALAFLALIGGIIAFIPVLRKTLVPLSNMVDSVEKVNAGNLMERFPVDQGQVEVDRLAVSYNGMLERLETSFAAEKEAKEQMRRFVADASHELRTPLTSIHGFLEVLLRGAMNQPDKLHKSLQSMYAESERMKKLVQDLLLLAKLDRSPTVQLSNGELDLLIKEMEPQLKMMAGSRKVSLQLASPISLCFDKDKIKQVVLNLFHNAVQHTDSEKGHIVVSLQKVSGGIELSIKDNGSGISKEHLSHVFERFYRSDSSRTRKYGGAGLGLSITKSIVDLHGGTISIESSAGEGSTFYVWLPMNLS